MGQGFWITRAGSTFCPQCGEPPEAEKSPSLWERCRRWILLADRIGPTLACRNGHTWRAPGHATMRVMQRPRVGRVLHLPVQILRPVRHSRRMTPVPLTYVMAAAAGVIIGVVVDLAGGPPWWLVGLAVVVIVWLFFMSTAFYGPFRLRRRDYVWMVNPQRGALEDERTLELAVSRGELPVYGLGDWAGSRAVGGSGRDQYGPHTIGLRYLDPDEPRRWVEVETVSRSHVKPTSMRRETLALNLATRILAAPDFSSMEDLLAWHDARRREAEGRLAELSWVPCELVVDGKAVVAEMVRVDDGIAVLTGHDGSVIEVLARNVEPGEIDLVTVTDLTPFLEGTRRLRGW